MTSTDQCLANDWPIASGPIEGACKNLIKDRMEHSGMRILSALRLPVSPPGHIVGRFAVW
jgi:hypothetical protein